MSDGLGRDPGAAAERTALAWHRTGIAAAATAAVALRGFAARPPLGPAVVALLVFVAVVSYLPGRREASTPRQLRLVTAAVSVAGGLALVLAATTP